MSVVQWNDEAEPSQETPLQDIPFPGSDLAVRSLLYDFIRLSV
jgi:hypothetical protein